MDTTVVKLNKRNRMVLPKAAREALGIEPGGRVLVVVQGQRVHLLPELEDWTDYVHGLGEDIWAALGGGERFLREERASWKE